MSIGLSEPGKTAVEEAVDKSPDTQPASQLIGDRLVSSKLITSEQLKYAQRVQKKLGSSRPLISIIQELHHLTDGQVRDALKRNPLEINLGDLLVELGYLRESDLKMAQSLQEEKPGSEIGDIILENHLLAEEQLIEALSIQLALEQVHPRSAVVDHELSRMASPKWLRLNELVPIERRNGAILVAMANPLNQKQLSAARQVFGQSLIIGLAPVSEIREVIDRFESGRGKSSASVASESLIVKTVEQMIHDAAASASSDIHFEPMKDRLRIRYRQDGVMTTYKDFPLDMAPALASRIKILAKADIAEKRRHQDGRIYFEHEGNRLDIRVSVYATIHGETIVMRLLNNRSQLLDVKELGMAPRILQKYVEDALEAPSGVVISTGPTGSGKTTTLYASVNYLNNPQNSIITAEDPVEYVIDGITQCSINPKINVTYEETLKHIVRQDPDIIVIGEIRDHFSAETAIQAALTGHKVITTFHTEDSIGGLLRLLNMDIEAFLISSTVVSVVAQRLVRRVCPHCAEDKPLTPSQIRRLGYGPQELLGISFKAARGCSRCRFQGYKGRLAIFELLVLNEMVKDALIHRKTSYEIRRIGTETTGLVTLLEDAIYKAIRGLTTFEEIIRNIPRLSPPRAISEVRRLLGETS